MVPIHSLIARILHDPQFGRGSWEISYLDRTQPSLVRVPFERVHPRHHIGFVFDVVDEDGVERSIPYHRVRQAWHDGKIVWSRLAPRTTRAGPRKPKRPPRKRVVQPRMKR